MYVYVYVCIRLYIDSCTDDIPRVWQVRKALHYCSVVWGLVICFHAPAGKILYIMGTAVHSCAHT